MTGTGTRIFAPGDEAAVRAVMEASLAADDLPGFVASDIDDSMARIPLDPGGTVVAVEEGVVVGYCTPRHDDLTVHPDHRRRGHGRRLVVAALELVRSRNLRELRLYGPTHLPATRAFIDALGFRYHSSLWELELASAVEVPPPTLPDGFVVRPYRGDEELRRYVALMNASFASHPTPLTWSEGLIARIHATPGFDPNDILLVTPQDRPEEPVAFTRLRLLPQETDEAGRPHGYIALLGVLPAWRRLGLGDALLRLAVGHLRARGVGTVSLSVQALNEGATRLYRSVGFRPSIEWPQFVLPATGRVASARDESAEEQGTRQSPRRSGRSGPSRSSAAR